MGLGRIVVHICLIPLEGAAKKRRLGPNSANANDHDGPRRIRDAVQTAFMSDRHRRPWEAIYTVFDAWRLQELGLCFQNPPLTPRSIPPSIRPTHKQQERSTMQTRSLTTISAL